MTISSIIVGVAGGMTVPNRERSVTKPRMKCAETCDALRRALNARAAGRQEPPYSASTPPSTQLPAQPKLRLVLHDAQLCAQVLSVLSSTAEIPASLAPIIFFTPTISEHSDELRLDYVKIQAGKEQILDGFLARAAVLP
jgi:hypothetical protein